MANMELLQEIKSMSKSIRGGDSDSGNAYLLGYIWATLTPEQQEETFNEFKKDFKNVPRRAQICNACIKMHADHS